MHYRKLGTTDIDVSLICLGTMTWGEQNTQAEAHRQLDYAIDHGVNFIDTAELYAIPPKAETQGLTESYIGSWLKQRSGRDSLVIATKVAGPGEFVSHIRGGPRLDADHMTRALDASLQRLQCDHIDLYQVHWPERQTNYFGELGFKPAAAETDIIRIEETLEVLDGFVRAGKVRHIGISNETPWGTMRYLQLARERGWPRIQSVQNPYNLLNRTYEIGMAEISWREHCGLLAYSPLGFGVLSGKYLDGQKPPGSRLALFQNYLRYSSEEAVAATGAYVQLARDHGLSPAQMALAYINSRPFLTANIIGATSMEQLQENIDSINVTLDAEVLEGIEAVHRRHPNPAP
ncbi:MAG: NADP(H)-dependent aldo-keto reductase [Gammaproteobacteria bacterium]|jgi:aryl-alcohol dehydrogenase-like predicted oxidoreductase